ncbi:MAG: GTP cyclohydrolase I FolE [Clostridiales bacterium]|nr:GTP cyclohydrolase I FolE [Clostridiales bacterium]
MEQIIKTAVKDEEKIRQGVKLILEGIGEDPSREGLLETPCRIAKMCNELFAAVGCCCDPIEAKVFAVQGSGMVAERGISFYSICEHHMLPFFGHASIAYLPDGEVIGLSKLVRIVDFYSRKLQLQERLTDEIAQAVSRKVKNKGVHVALSAEHLCVSMRGIAKTSSTTVSMASTGAFASDKGLRDEAMALFQGTFCR